MNKFIIAAAATIGFATAAVAAPLPSYPTPGSVNGAVYTFTKKGDGDLIAYFVGDTAGLTNVLGVFAGATDLGTGLSNADPLGTAFNYGFVADGTELTFYINTSAGETFSSDPSLNEGGLQHVFSAPWGGDLTVGITDFPSGDFVYVGFEDLPGGGDLDYDDINFVFENTGVVVPEPGTWAMMIAGFGLVGFAARRRKTLAAA